jgi:hypothetical protein
MLEENNDQLADGGEQQSQDHAAASDAGVGDAGKAGAGTDATALDASSDEGQVELIGQEKWDKLQGDPAALRKELNRAFTQRSQELAATRKKVEPYGKFVEALESDAVGTVTRLAERLGLKIQPSDTKAEVATKARTLEEEVSEIVRTELGPEYEDMSDKLASAIGKATDAVVRSRVESLSSKQEQIISEQAQREAKSALDEFAKAHPDWGKYEDAMTALSQKMLPGEGMTDTEYLENLYLIVTRDRKDGDGVRKVVDRMKASAKEGAAHTVPGSHVSGSPAKLPTFGEAAAAASRGQRFE